MPAGRSRAERQGSGAEGRASRAVLLVLPLVLALGGCGSPAASPVKAQVACAQEKGWLRYRCTVTLSDRQTGKPIEGANVVLSADMPSMPLVHSVPPTPATAGSAPGAYEGVLQLEMAGRWVIGIRVTGPVSDAFTHDLDVSTPPG